MRRLAVLALIPLLTACGGGDDDVAEAESPGFTVVGVATLTDFTAVDYDPRTNEDCYGINGYDDLVEGAAVTILDADGTKVGLGKLGEGQLQSNPIACSFDFSIADVEGEGDIFSVQLAGRDPVDFARENAGRLDLTIG